MGLKRELFGVRTLVGSDSSGFSRWVSSAVGVDGDFFFLRQLFFTMVLAVEVNFWSLDC